MSLISRIQKLEKQYLVKDVCDCTFVIRFVNPAHKNKALNKLRDSEKIYERMIDESEDNFVARVCKLSVNKIIFSSD